MKRVLGVIAAVLIGGAWTCPSEAQWAIEARIARANEATRAENLEEYMRIVPADLRIAQGDGSVITRDLVRDRTREIWARIESTSRLETTIESFSLKSGGDTAQVVLVERWDRVEVDGAGTRYAVSSVTQRRETWRRRGTEWLRYASRELSREVTVDGVRRS